MQSTRDLVRQTMPLITLVVLVVVQEARSSILENRKPRFLTRTRM